MNIIAEALVKNFNEFPNNIALRSKNYKNGINYKELYELSGKVYAYLKQKGIGKEKFVLILLPRDIQIQICIAGLLRAGAAFTVVEDSYPKERIEFITNDVKPVLILDNNVFSEMMNYNPLDGYEDVDPHDACYAVYTSGSTGTPKGVLQEYGQIEHYMACTYRIGRLCSDFSKVVCGIICPLNFLAAYTLVFHCFYVAACAYVISYDIVKNFAVFGEYLEKENINIVFMTPSMLKVFKAPSNLLVIIIGGENPGSIYVEGTRVVNFYSSSESGIDIAYFEIDKKYEKVPAGKNGGGMKIYLLDDDGKETDKGEICFKNEYFRGYINDPKKTEIALVNGLFHSGDMGYFDKDGNLVICGRKDDMIKINGNRIEPMEIERSLKELLGVNYVVAKGFSDDNRGFITAYFIKNELAAKGILKDDKLDVDFDELQKKLLDKIPYYMIPTYYVALNAFPLNANGKLDKKALKAPEVAKFHSEFNEATTDLEKYLCDLFKKVLSVDKVGIDDDFYLIGGDSLTSMEFMAECKLKLLTINDLFTYRTPRKIAEYYTKNFDQNIDIDERNKLALAKPQPVLNEIVDFIDVNFYAPTSTMYNLPVLIKLKNDIDVKRFAQVVDKVLKIHPAFQTIFFFDEDTEIKQKYCPELYMNIEIKNITKKEFDEVQGTLIQKFDMIVNTLLHRKAIYQIDNGDAYFFLDTNHLITDGTSINLVLKQINDCYYNPETVLPNDYYYLIQQDAYNEQQKFKSSDNEVRKHYEELAKEFLNEKDFMPAYYPDSEKTDLTQKIQICHLDARKEAVALYCKENNITENEFFMCCLLLSMAKRNKSNKVLLNFIHNGRNNNLLTSSCGLLFHTHTVFANLEKYKTLKDFYLNIKEQAEYGIKNGDFNCCTLISEYISYSIFFLYQKDIYSLDRFDMVDKILTPPNKHAAADSLLEFNLLDSSNIEDFVLKLTYGKGFYKDKTIFNLCKDFNNFVNKLVSSISDTPINKVFKL